MLHLGGVYAVKLGQALRIKQLLITKLVYISKMFMYAICVYYMMYYMLYDEKKKCDHIEKNRFLRITDLLWPH